MSKSNRPRKARHSNQRVPHRRDQRRELQQLDVRMRSKKETQLRRIQGLKALFRIAIMVTAIVLTVQSARWFYRKAFYENPEFYLTELRVITNGTLTQPQILRHARIVDGMNLLAIDLEEVRRRLDDLPQVEKADVCRELPSRLTISIRERVPVAWLEVPSLGIHSWSTTQGYLLDRAGYVLKCDALLPQYRALPIVRAHSLERVKAGARVDSEQLLTALDLTRMSNDLFFDAHVEMRMVELRAPYSLLAHYSNDAEVVFGLEDLDVQLEDLKLIFDHSETKNRLVATVNLMVRKNIPVRYFDFSSDGLGFPADGTDPSSVSPPATGASDHDSARKRLDALRAILGRG